MILIASKYLIPKGYRGLTIFPFVILSDASDKENSVLINHEKIHLRQQIELLILPFYVWYLIAFLRYFLRYRNFSKAYRNISFEKEAYDNEMDLKYLQKRNFFNFLKYCNN